MNNGRYTQLQFVASGGFAEVYRAFDTRTETTVAIKILSNPTPDKVHRLQRERDMLTIHLNNPFVVDIFDSDLSGAAPYLVLEYSELGSLQKYVTSRRDWQRIAGWLNDIACGLTAVHERGDLIRDIKPSNLLRFKDANGSEFIKIADFGLGQRPDSPSGPMTTSPFGTEGYIDPIARITQTFSSASDIYSFGITARELLTGSKNPGNSIPGPPEFGALIASMTDLNVGNRPTARQISQQLQCILQTFATPAAPEVGGKGLLYGLLGLAAVVVAANSNSWDGYAQRYRDSRGRFRSGWFS